MIAEIGKLILECLKLAPRYLIALGLIAGVLLFGPDTFLKRCGLTEFAQNYRSTLGIVFVGSIALGCVGFVYWIANMIKDRLWKRKMQQHIAQRLQRLTEDEKQILRFYIAKNTRANTLRIDDGIVQGLKADGIIFMSANIGNLIEGMAHNIGDFAWEYLHEHPDLLVGTTNFYRTDKREGW